MKDAEPAPVARFAVRERAIATALCGPRLGLAAFRGACAGLTGVHAAQRASETALAALDGPIATALALCRARLAAAPVLPPRHVVLFLRPRAGTGVHWTAGPARFYALSRGPGAAATSSFGARAAALAPAPGLAVVRTARRMAVPNGQCPAGVSFYRQRRALLLFLGLAARSMVRAIFASPRRPLATTTSERGARLAARPPGFGVVGAVVPLAARRDASDGGRVFAAPAMTRARAANNVLPVIRHRSTSWLWSLSTGPDVWDFAAPGSRLRLYYSKWGCGRRGETGAFSAMSVEMVLK